MDNYEILNEKKKNLEHKDIDLIVADFDSTIFDRSEQLEKHENFKIYRQNEWNDYIMNVYWIDNLINDFYKGKPYPKKITSLLRENHDLILTAGYEEIQTKKLQATWLDKYNYIIVLEWKLKIYPLVKYIIETLQFIPAKITIYEDKPEIFIENKKFLEDFLGTKIEILKVTMDWNDKDPLIEKIWE